MRDQIRRRSSPMTRVLLSSALALVACSSSLEAPARPTVYAASTPPIPFERWLDRWKEARACLIAPADDFDTAVELAVQSGRDCRKLLRALDSEPIVEDALVPMWRFIRVLVERLETASSLKERVSRLRDLTHTVDEFELQVRQGPPEPLEAD